MGLGWGLAWAFRRLPGAKLRPLRSQQAPTHMEVVPVVPPQVLIHILWGLSLPHV